jgi:hypothetical protein
MKKARPTFKKLGPGEYRVRIPADYDGFKLPEDLIFLDVMRALRADPVGTRPGPTGAAPVEPLPSGAERKRLHIERRTVALMKVARSQRELNALCENEGLPTTTWTDSGQATVQQRRRLARERKATVRRF